MATRRCRARAGYGACRHGRCMAGDARREARRPAACRPSAFPQAGRHTARAPLLRARLFGVDAGARSARARKRPDRRVLRSGRARPRGNRADLLRRQRRRAALRPGRAALVECALARTGRRRRRHAACRRHRGRRAIARERRAAYAGRTALAVGAVRWPHARNAAETGGRRSRRVRRLRRCSRANRAGQAARRCLGRAMDDGRVAVRRAGRLIAWAAVRGDAPALRYDRRFYPPESLPCKYSSMPTRVPPSSRTCCFAPRVVPRSA
ncbi:hypothetical protein BDI4_1190019 [Burkholderia diffusa]|nr:hypothetical protein BDI4_1190019 [Burkholderia diffusa]